MAERDPSFGVLHGLYWFTANLAAVSPLFLLVDDAHWCDSPSLRFLVHRARRLEGVPMAVIVAVRSGAEPGTDDVLREQLRVCAGEYVVQPAPLSP